MERKIRIRTVRRTVAADPGQPERRAEARLRDHAGRRAWHRPADGCRHPLRGARPARGAGPHRAVAAGRPAPAVPPHRGWGDEPRGAARAAYPTSPRWVSASSTSRRMRPLLIRCYPARWRARYGDEFEALLEERPLGPFDVADVLLGALDAHLRLRRWSSDPQSKGDFHVAPIGGFAAILGVSLAGHLRHRLDWRPAAKHPTPERDRTSGGGWPLFLVALTGMSAFQARSSPSLIWTAFALTAVGMVVVFVAGVSDLVGAGPRDWREGLLPYGAVAALVGSALLRGIATFRGSVLSRHGALALVIGPAVGLIGGIAVGQNLLGARHAARPRRDRRLPGRLVAARGGGNWPGSSNRGIQARLKRPRRAG